MKSMKNRNITQLAFSCLVYGLSLGDLLSKEIEVAPSADVGLLYSQTPPLRPNLLNGGSASIGASLHSNAQGSGSCSLLRFDLSDLPRGAKILGARLILNPVYSYPPERYPRNEELCVFQVAPENSDWIEGSGISLKDPEIDPIMVPGSTGGYLNLQTFTNETTHEGVRWFSGTTISTVDFTGEMGSLALSEHGLVANQIVEIELDAAAVQKWLLKPDLVKAGLALWMRSDASLVSESRFAVFHSREDSVPPRLVISFTTD